MEGKTENRCKLCGASRPSLWIHRGVCLECERCAREAGRCPFATLNSRCDPRLFCRHTSSTGQCLLCDECQGCQTCRLCRGDGADVARLVEQLDPLLVFLDWDRTFCTTRGGGSPLRGSHTLDPELLAVVHDRPDRVHIVTRNSYRDDLREFLGRYVSDDIPIHTCKKGVAKAEVVFAQAPPHACVLFVDDSIEEHLGFDEPAWEAKAKTTGANVHRVLFVRG